MESAPPRKKRRSKWDVSSAPPASRDGGGGGVVVADVLAAAQRAVAARQQPPPAQPHVQAAAAGSLQPGLSSPLGSLATMQAPEATVDINSCGSRARISLTKKATQTDVSSCPTVHLGLRVLTADHRQIHRSTGAAVNVRGQFCAPGQKLPSGRDALHLQVTGETQEQVDNAVAMINQIIASAAGGGGPRSARSASFSHKISVGIDALSTRFQVVYKICGPNDSHLGHIRATGASACLVGRGAPGPAGYGSQEPLAILLTSSTEAGLRKALDLTESLLATVNLMLPSIVRVVCAVGLMLPVLRFVRSIPASSKLSARMARRRCRLHHLHLRGDILHLRHPTADLRHCFRFRHPGLRRSHLCYLHPLRSMQFPSSVSVSANECFSANEYR